MLHISMLRLERWQNDLLPWDCLQPEWAILFPRESWNLFLLIWILLMTPGLTFKGIRPFRIWNKSLILSLFTPKTFSEGEMSLINGAMIVNKVFFFFQVQLMVVGPTAGGPHENPLIFLKSRSSACVTQGCELCLFRVIYKSNSNCMYTFLDKINACIWLNSLRLLTKVLLFLVIRNEWETRKMIKLFLETRMSFDDRETSTERRAANSITSYNPA